MGKKVEDVVVFQARMSEVKLKEGIDGQDGGPEIVAHVPFKAALSQEDRHTLGDMIGMVEVTVRRVQGELPL